MPFDLSTISVYPATHEQTIESRRRTQNEWSRGLTLEEHLARDAAQEHLEGSLGGRFMTWVLAPRDDPTTIDFKCACETFKRTGLVYNPSVGAIEEVTCYAIASLFTPADKRGQGFGRHMMSLLHWVLADETLLPARDFPVDKWGGPPPKVDGLRNGRFTALWSDVGDLYSTCGPFSAEEKGWVIRGISTIMWDVDESLFLNPIDPVSDWIRLDNAGVSKLWEADAETIHHDLTTGKQLSFAFQPSNGVASFQHRRLDMYLERLDNPPNTLGVISEDRQTYATWAIDPRPPVPRLVVTRLRAGAQGFESLVSKIFEVARKHDVKTIEIWGLSKELQNAARKLGARVYERDDHLPAFKWYGKEAEAEVAWAFNERFCWC
ncbi:hypothetical protein C8F01DRAFT_1111167 [Mycena amicta]|nr:hypothetical protein C8F01DRAFT_1111167 [Mycena amicta]